MRILVILTKVTVLFQSILESFNKGVHTAQRSEEVSNVANRAQRRANNKAAQKAGTNGQPEASRSATDQARFNRQADRVAEGTTEWVPRRVDPVEDVVSEPAVNVQTMAVPTRKRSAKGWMKFFSWALIAISAVAFLIVMWIPNLPLWAIATVSGVFIVGVLSLFIVRGDHDKNPYLDENGTAV